ncbi:CRISPR-associated endonuclease Cas2 [candidate division KSB1 bacterium]|nr:MAG: CRISPR-associated endonuclease Cas2 [candidate division KSB1 bacterium]
MYVILVYDVEQKRVAKVCKYLRCYMNWIQNSVFEGELTEGKLKEIKFGLKKIIQESKDSVLIYSFADQKQVAREIMGIEKNPVDTIL